MISERMFPSWRLKQLKSDTKPNRLQHRYEVLKEKKNQTWGPVNIYRWRGGGVKEDLRGDHRVFRKNRRRIKRHQLSIKCRTIAGEPSLRGEFYRDKNKIPHLPPQGINNTDPLRKMALFRAVFKKNFNFKETGKLID